MQGKRRTLRRRSAAPPMTAPGGEEALAGGRPRTDLAVVLLVVAAVVITVYWPVLSADALLKDDVEYLTNNRLVQTPGWDSVKRFVGEVLTPSTVHGYYQPLSMISLMVDCGLGGRPDYVRPFRRTSLALHVLNTSLLIVLFYLLFKQAWVAGLAGLLFGVHPLTVESVAWLSDRKTLLGTFFALWSILLYVCYTRAGRWRWFAAAWVAYVLALLSKPTTTPVPALLLMLDFWPLRRLNWRAVLEKIPFFTIGGVSAVITFVSQSNTAPTTLPGSESAMPVLLSVTHNIVFYLRKIVWPVDLTPHYGFPVEPYGNNPAILAGVIGTVVLLAVLVLSLRWTKAAFTGWLVFFLAILPTLGIIGFTDVIAADRFTYFPMLGMLLIAVWALRGLWGQAGGPRRVVAVAIVVLLAGSASYATRGYLTQWRDVETLHRRMVRLAPQSPEPYYNLGLILKQSGNEREAAACYRKALDIKPDYDMAHNNLGSLLSEQGKVDEAATCFRAAVQSNPGNHRALTNLAGVLVKQNRSEQALTYLSEALQIEPNDAITRSTMASALLQLGRIDDALQQAKTATALAPDDYRPQFTLGLVLNRVKRPGEALAAFDTVLRLQPDYVPACFQRGLALEQLGRIDEAIAAYKRVLALNPQNAAARSRLNTVMGGGGRTP